MLTVKLQHRTQTKFKALEDTDEVYDYSNQNEYQNTINNDLPLLKC